MDNEIKYELSHDLLAKQVYLRFSQQEKDSRKAERMLKDSYENYILNRENLHPKGLYLSEDNSEFIREHINEEFIDKAELTFLLEVEKYYQLETKNKRKRLILLRIGFAIMAILTIYSFYSYLEIKNFRETEKEYKQPRTISAIKDKIQNLKFIEAYDQFLLEEANLPTDDNFVKLQLELAFYFLKVKDTIRASKINLLHGFNAIELINAYENDSTIDEFNRNILNDLKEKYFPKMIVINPGRKDSVKSLPFEISEHEISLFQYELFLRSENKRQNSKDESYIAKNNIATSQNFSQRLKTGVQGFLPIRSIEIPEMINYANWLSRQKGYKPIYRETLLYTILPNKKLTVNDSLIDPPPSNSSLPDSIGIFVIPNSDGFRFPSEIEWEYVATGGNIWDRKEKPKWGSNKALREFQKDVFREYACYKANSYNEKVKNYLPKFVKSLKVNLLGTYDIFGNVKELCWPPKDPIGDPLVLNFSNIVLKGGSFKSNFEECNPYISEKMGKKAQSDEWGFRLVRSLNPN